MKEEKKERKRERERERERERKREREFWCVIDKIGHFQAKIPEAQSPIPLR